MPDQSSQFPPHHPVSALAAGRLLPLSQTPKGDGIHQAKYDCRHRQATLTEGAHASSPSQRQGRVPISICVQPCRHAHVGFPNFATLAYQCRRVISYLSYQLPFANCGTRQSTCGRCHAHRKAVVHASRSFGQTGLTAVIVNVVVSVANGSLFFFPIQSAKRAMGAAMHIRANI